MQLVYEATGKPVKVGDKVNLDGTTVIVDYFREPSTPASSGKVTVRYPRTSNCREYFVSVIGAKWAGRDDRDGPPVKIVRRGQQ